MEKKLKLKNLDDYSFLLENVVLDRFRLSLPSNGNLEQHKRGTDRRAPSTRRQRLQKLQRLSPLNENPKVIPHAEKHKIFPNDKNFKKRKREQNHKIFLRKTQSKRKHRKTVFFHPSFLTIKSPCSLHLVLYR